MRCRLIKYTCILLFCSLWTHAQTTISYVESQNKRAIELNREGKFKQAETLLNQLLDELRNNGSQASLFALTYQTKAKVVQNLGRYATSIDLARKSLQHAISAKDSFNIADNYNTIGINHYFLSAYDSTIYYYEKSFDIKKEIKSNNYSLAVSAYNLGIVYEDLGQFEKAIELYRGAEKYLLAIGDKKTFLSDVYVGLANISFYSEDINRAEQYAEKALDVGIKSYGEYNPNMTFVYVSYANILESKGAYNEAIKLLEKSLKIRRETYGENHRWTCEAHYDLGNSYFMSKNYDKAELLYKKAISIGEITNSRQFLANARNFLAGLYLEREMKLDETEELLLQALNINTSIYGTVNEVISDNYFQLAKLYKLGKNESKFKKNLEQSLGAANYHSDSLQKVIAPFHALQSLELLREWYEDRYKETQETAFLEESFKIIDQEVAIIKYSQKNFSSDRSKINLANEYHSIFESGIYLCWLLYYKTDNHKYLEKAFELSETNRNTTLLRGLQHIRFRSNSFVPDSILDIETQVKKELEKVKMDLFYEKSAHEHDEEAYSELLNKRIKLSTKLDSIQRYIEKNDTRYKNNRYERGAIGLSEFKKQIDSKSQVITYFLGEENLFSFSISNDSIRFLRAPVAPILRSKVESFIQSLSKREEVDELSDDLYLYLLKQQLRTDKENLVIIADNVLNYLPFEILKREKGAFLINSFCVSYAGSASLYSELSSEFFDYDLPQLWAGFSPDYKNGKQLNSSSQEVSEVKTMMKGVEFLGDDASKINFFNINQQFSVIHLAMHAEIDQYNSRYHKLLFSDGDLTASEIYVANSKSNLAVLSACNTGFGKIEKGEGVMSMARAFHFSGIPSVVMSLWRVPDRETKSIMVNFYKYIKEGKRKTKPCSWQNWTT